MVPLLPVVPEPPSVLRVRADCGCRLFTAKLGVYLSHQLLDDRPRHTLQRSEARSRGSVASTVGRCNGFRTRSVKLASNRANRHTLKAAPAAAILVSESGATVKRRKRRNDPNPMLDRPAGHWASISAYR
jgi:hypothetical protein